MGCSPVRLRRLLRLHRRRPASQPVLQRLPHHRHVPLPLPASRRHQRRRLCPPPLCPRDLLQPRGRQGGPQRPRRGILVGLLAERRLPRRRPVAGARRRRHAHAGDGRPQQHHHRLWGPGLHTADERDAAGAPEHHVERRSAPFFVPYRAEQNRGAMAGAGSLGVWGSERGVTFYEVLLAGHELPGYSAGSGYRSLELLLERIKDFSDTTPLALG